MLNFGILQQGMLSCGPLLDKSIRVVSSVVALLGRRLIELFLNIGIRFIFGSFGIRTGMAGPVNATDFRRRSQDGRRRGSIVLSPRLIDEALVIECDRKLKLESKN